MTWLNTFYLLAVLVALSLIGLTTSAEATTNATLATVSSLEVLDSLSPTSTTGRLPILIIGIGTVLLTYHKAVINFTRKS